MTGPAPEAPAPSDVNERRDERELATRLFQSERQRVIVMLVQNSGRVECVELAARFDVTTETIRRDLTDLQDQRLVRRVHGGALPWGTTGFEQTAPSRSDHEDDDARRMASLAVTQLPQTGSIIIDSGDTLERFSEAIPVDCGLRIVTNSLLTAQILASQGCNELIVLGGKLSTTALAMVDASVVAAVEALTVDTLFISSDGLTAERGLSTSDREDAALKQAMINAANRVVVLVDGSKVGEDSFARFADVTDVDVLITTPGAESSVLREIERRGTTVLLA